MQHPTSSRSSSPQVSRADWPVHDQDVLDALQRAYHDGSWGHYQGPACEEFRCQFAEFHEVEFVRLTCSGTVAVELGLVAMGLKAGDEVILAGYDFGGNFRAIEHLAARPVVVDVDSDLRLQVGRLQEALTAKTRAVIVSHLHGSLANIKAIHEWGARHSVAIVEDACQAPGAFIDGRLAGTWGHVGVHSFGGSKLLTAGRGGAVITNDAMAYQRMKIYAERGNDAYPMSELQASVLIPQLKKLQARNRTRQSAAVRLVQRLQDVTSLRLVGVDSLPHASCFKLAIELSRELLSRQPRETWVVNAQAHGIAIDAGFRSFARRSERRCRRVGELNQSAFAGAAIAVLHHPILLTGDENINRLADVLRKVSD